MNWLTNFVKPRLKAIKSKILRKENLWVKCSSCGQMNYHKDLQERLYMCSNCDAHLAMPINERLISIYDDGIYDTKKIPKVLEDPLSFKDKMKYTDRLKIARKRTSNNDAILVVNGKINNISVPGTFSGINPTPTKETKIMKKLKNEAENNIFFPRFVFILTFPAVNNPDNAPNPADPIA